MVGGRMSMLGRMLLGLAAVVALSLPAHSAPPTPSDTLLPTGFFDKVRPLTAEQRRINSWLLFDGNLTCIVIALHSPRRR